MSKTITVLFTGLPSAGKTTLATMLSTCVTEKFTDFRHVLIDGDAFRHGVCKDLGFSESDREENLRRFAEVAHLLNEQGVSVIASFVAPMRRHRALIKDIVGADRYSEIYVCTPLAICEERDTKGLYKKARKGLIQSMTGIDSPYEAPVNPDFVVDTTKIVNHFFANALISSLNNKFQIGL